MDLTDVLVIADNSAGWRFCVGRSGGRWLGFAAPGRSPAELAFASEGLEVSPQMLMVMPEVSEGYQLGVEDRDRAIRLTGAVAQEDDGCYGGVERWFVPEDLRGRPDDFRCKKCDHVGCDGTECGDDYDDGGEDYDHGDQN